MGSTQVLDSSSRRVVEAATMPIAVSGLPKSSYHSQTVLPEPPPISTPLASGYDFHSILGQGGMGVVYLAEQKCLKRMVAYKLLTQLGTFDLESKSRFQGEAEFLAKLQHPNIVQIYHFGYEHHEPYIVMEYLAGGTLANRLRQYSFRIDDAVAMMRSIAEGVGHAHRCCVIHRDLKPGNILLTLNGEPKVADFGLARDLTELSLTRTGSISGTPIYMSPEQLQGKKELTPAADVWALGLIFYEMLTGNRPYAGTEPEQVLHHLMNSEAITPRHYVPNISRDIETICMKCLEKDPRRRYTSAIELADDLIRVQNKEAILARPVSSMEKGWRWCKKNRLAAVLVALVFTLMLSGTLIATILASWAKAEKSQAEAAKDEQSRLREIAEEAQLNAVNALAAEQVARKQAEDAQQKLHHMVETLANLVTGLKNGERMAPSLLAKLDETILKLQDNPLPPVLYSDILFAIGVCYREKSETQKSIEILDQCVQLRTEHLGEGHPRTIDAIKSKLYAIYSGPMTEDQRKMAIETLERLCKIEGGQHEKYSIKQIDIHWNLLLYYSDGESKKKLCEYLLEVAKRNMKEDDSYYQWIIVNCYHNDLFSMSEEDRICLFTKAYSIFLEKCKPDSSEVVWTRATLAYLHEQNKNYAEELELLKDVLQADVQYNGSNHSFTRYSRVRLSRCYENLQRYEEAIEIQEQLCKNYQDINSEDQLHHHQSEIQRLRNLIQEMPR